jgi:hypothetical protein
LPVIAVSEAAHGLLYLCCCRLCESKS